MKGVPIKTVIISKEIALSEDYFKRDSDTNEWSDILLQLGISEDDVIDETIFITITNVKYNSKKGEPVQIYLTLTLKEVNGEVDISEDDLMDNILAQLAMADIKGYEITGMDVSSLDISVSEKKKE